MWTAIVGALGSLLSKILDLFTAREEAKKVAVEKANTEEMVRRAEVIADVEQKDEAEKLVKIIEAGNEDDKQKALEELRRLVSD